MSVEDTELYKESIKTLKLAWKTWSDLKRARGRKWNELDRKLELIEEHLYRLNEEISIRYRDAWNSNDPEAYKWFFLLNDFVSFDQTIHAIGGSY